jgi:hypothetical protein
MSRVQSKFGKHSLLDHLWTTTPRIIYQARPGTTASGASWQTLASFTVPGGSLGTGGSLEVKWFGRKTDGSDNVSFRFSYGGTVVATLTNTGMVLNASGRIDMELWGDGSITAQRGHIFRVVATQSVGGTAAVNSAVDQTLLIEADFTTDSDDIITDQVRATLYRQRG